MQQKHKCIKQIKLNLRINEARIRRLYDCAHRACFRRFGSGCGDISNIRISIAICRHITINWFNLQSVRVVAVSVTVLFLVEVLALHHYCFLFSVCLIICSVLLSTPLHCSLHLDFCSCSSVFHVPFICCLLYA